MNETENQSKNGDVSQNHVPTEAELDAAFDAYDGCPTAGQDLAKNDLVKDGYEIRRALEIERDHNAQEAAQ